uniref:Uncharacterized protein n=1 Tax=Physcomitrium patens TaxID=3218 RepID=A0A2K1IYF3_PHYPA|nr:hypothetical protein PHYPA_024118 [Physcomitrium patens]
MPALLQCAECQNAPSDLLLEFHKPTLPSNTRLALTNSAVLVLSRNAASINASSQPGADHQSADPIHSVTAIGHPRIALSYRTTAGNTHGLRRPKTSLQPELGFPQNLTATSRQHLIWRVAEAIPPPATMQQCGSTSSATTRRSTQRLIEAGV